MDGIFLTLTYDELPLLGSLNPQHPQLFLKRLRKRLNGNTPQFLDDAGLIPNPDFIVTKYFLVGEYGERTQRPHYHCILWMPRPSDEVLYQAGQNPLWRSLLLEKDWSHGRALYGEVTAASAMYCAGYTLKKLYGRTVYPDKIPPFLRASKNLGRDGLTPEEIANDLVTISPGYRLPLPRYVVERLSPEALMSVKEARLMASVQASRRPQPSRESRAIVSRSRVNLYKGKL